MDMNNKSSNSGGSITGVLCFWGAFFLSYLKWGKFWLALGHAFCGLIYIIWYVLNYTRVHEIFFR
jgi:hypothetical protein